MSIKSQKDSNFVSTERKEITLLSKRFKSYKTGQNVSPTILYALQSEMHINLGRCKREEIEAVLALLGYGKNVKP